MEERRNYRYPRFSPEGMRLAVVVQSGRGSDIWVLDVERGTPTQLTFGGVNEYFPTPFWPTDDKARSLLH